MEKLEKLTQGEFNEFFRADGTPIKTEFVLPVGKIRTLTEANPCLDISNVIDEMTERKSVFIPKRANAYVQSDFSGDTQHLRKSDLEGRKKFYCVFAVQFYYVCNFLPPLDR